LLSKRKQSVQYLKLLKAKPLNRIYTTRIYKGYKKDKNKMTTQLDVTRLILSIVAGYSIIFLVMWLFRKRKKTEPTIVEKKEK